MALTTLFQPALLLLLLLVTVIKETASQHTSTAVSPWNYDPNSPNGPDHWSGSYPACGGESQSPIDIKVSRVTFDPVLTEFTFTNYDNSIPSTFELINTGASIQVRTSNSGSAIAGGGLGAYYKLAQLHFHWGQDSQTGSEHLLDGRASPIEIHFVHWSEKYETFDEATEYSDDPDGVAVLSVFVQVNSSSGSSVLGNLTTYFNKIPHPSGTTTTLKIPSFSLKSLLPKNRAYFRYQGSLTTPACQESVTWTVFHNPVYLSEKEIAAFRSIYDSTGKELLHNFRPPQPLNERVVFTSIPVSATSHQATESATVLATLSVVLAITPHYWLS